VEWRFGPLEEILRSDEVSDDEPFLSSKSWIGMSVCYLVSNVSFSPARFPNPRPVFALCFPRAGRPALELLKEGLRDLRDLCTILEERVEQEIPNA